MTSDFDDRAEVAQAIRDALAEDPAVPLPFELLEVARSLATDESLTDDEFEELRARLAADEAFTDRVEHHLPGGRRGIPRDFGSSQVRAVWWTCPVPGCPREPEGGTAKRPFRHSHCPDHPGVRLVRA